MSENKTPEFDDFIDLDIEKEVSNDDRVPLLRLDGVMYYANTKIPAGVVLDFMDHAGDEEYEGNFMRDLVVAVLGEEVYETIKKNPKVDVKAFKKIMERAQQVAFADFSGK